MSNADRILELLKDGKPHFSAEFRDRLGLLEYRRRLTEIRRRGYNVVSLEVKDSLWSKPRPAYQLINEKA